MEWTKVLLCFLWATSCTVCVKTDHSNQENATRENINSKENKKMQLNATKTADESLEESPSETIRFKKAFILKQRETNSSNIKSEARDKSENGKEPKSAKDLENEENRYFPVMTFTETSKSHPERQWKIIPPEAPAYRGHNVFRNPVLTHEPQSFVRKPEMSSTPINYPPPGSSESRYIDDSRSGEYPESFDSHGPRYPNSENPSNLGHGVHTETTHDYGRFLDVEYKSKIEKDAEEIIRRKKAQNSTREGRPPPPNEENRQYAPEQYPHYEATKRPGQYHHYQKPGHTSFYHLGNFRTPVPYKPHNAYFNKNGESYRHTSQEHPNTEKYPTHQQTFAPRKPEPQTGYYIPKKPVSSTETYRPQISHYRKQHPSYHSGPPNAPRQYDHSAEQSPPTYIQREPLPSVRKTPQSPTSKEQVYPNYYHGEEKNYPNSGYAQPPNYASPQHPSAEKNLPVSLNSGHTQAPEHVSLQYHSGEKNLPLSYHSDAIQPPDHTSSQHHSGERSTPFSHNSGYIQTPEHASLQYQSGENKYPSSHNSDHNQQPEHAPLPYHSEEKNLPVPYGQYEDSSTPPTKEFQNPYSQTPQEPALPPTDTGHLNKHPVSHTNPPYAKTTEKIHQERSYYKSYKSLMDLYKSYGFKPLDIDEMPEFFPPRYAFGNPFSEKIPISAPISGAISTEQYTPNHQVPGYVQNVDNSAPGQNNYGAPYEGTWPSSNPENSREKAPYKLDSNGNSTPLRLKNTYHHEQIPYDSNRSPVVSTEHHDTSELSKPGVFNAQFESPRETFYQDEFPTKSSIPLQLTEDVSLNAERKPIRIKDYNSETYFANPSQENEANSEKYSQPRDVPTHSVIRKNPPYLKNSNLEDEKSIEYFERPRKYPQNIPSYASSEERMHDFRSPNAAQEGLRESKPSYADDSYHEEKNPSKGVTPNYTMHQWMSKPDNSPKVPRNTQNHVPADDQQYRNSKRKVPEHDSEKMLFDAKPEYEGREKKSTKNTNSDSRTKKNRKRSSQKRSKKHKPSRRSHNGDHLLAEGSTNQWGMERHKDIDGQFQYASVPGAKAFEFGYRMGGPDQMREKHHRTRGIQSKIKVNWEDKNGDSGDHYWEFNHDSREDDEEKKPKKDKSHE